MVADILIAVAAATLIWAAMLILVARWAVRLVQRSPGLAGRLSEVQPGAPVITAKDIDDLVEALEKQKPPKEYIDLWGVRYPAEDQGKKPPDLRDSQ